MEALAAIVIALLITQIPVLTKESAYLKREYRSTYDSVSKAMPNASVLERTHVIDSIHLIVLRKLGYARAESDTIKRKGLLGLFRKENHRARDTL